MDFSDVISDKISSYTQERNERQADLLNPQYHKVTIETACRKAIDDLTKVPGDKERLLAEAISIISQVPDFALSVWTAAMDDLKALQQEISRWESMRDMYIEWTALQEAKAEAREELKEAILSGEIQEPTRESSMRRDAGDHPGVKLSSYRMASSELEGGEDSEG